MPVKKNSTKGQWKKRARFQGVGGNMQESCMKGELVDSIRKRERGEQVSGTVQIEDKMAGKKKKNGSSTYRTKCF